MSYAARWAIKILTTINYSYSLGINDPHNGESMVNKTTQTGISLSFKAEMHVEDQPTASRIMKEFIPTRLGKDLHALYNEYLLKKVFPRTTILMLSSNRSIEKLVKRGYIERMFAIPDGNVFSTYNKRDKKWNSPFTQKAMIRLNYGKLGVFTHNMKNDPRWMSMTIIAAFITGLVNILVALFKN